MAQDGPDDIAIDGDDEDDDNFALSFSAALPVEIRMLLSARFGPSMQHAPSGQ